MYRLSQSFINLRYGNPIGVIAGLTQAFTQLGRGVSGAAVALPVVLRESALSPSPLPLLPALWLCYWRVRKFGLKERQTSRCCVFNTRACWIVRPWRAEVSTSRT